MNRTGSAPTRLPLIGTFALLAEIAFCLSTTAQQPIQSPDEFQAIERLVQQGHLAQARTELIETLKQEPASVEGYNLLGIIETERQDFPSALAAFQEALQVAPRSAKTHVNLGNLYLAQKMLPQAELEFRNALRLEPVNPEANYNMGLLLIAKGAPAEAIPYFTRIHPQTTESQINLIRAYLHAKRTSDALRMTTQLSAGKDADVALHFSLGVMLLSEKQFKPAQLELQKADALQPGSPDILANLGSAYYGGGEMANAELSLSRALKLKPESPETLYLLAQVYRSESRSLDALDLLVRANKLTPGNPDILFLMAQIGMSQRFFADAIPLLEKASQLDPNRVEIRSALGECYFKSDQVEKAIQEFDKVIQLEPNGRAYAYLGLSYAYLGRFDQAKVSFQHALKIDPHDTFCLFHLGYLAEQQGDTAAADTVFQKVLQADPNFPYALLEMANLRIEQKRFQEAEGLLKRYVRLSANPATGYYKLVTVERNLGHAEEARQDMATFQELFKKSTPSANAYVHLFDYLDKRSEMATAERNRLDIEQLMDQNANHPDQPDVLYPLAEAYFNEGKVTEALAAIEQLDKVSASDERLLAGVGVLLARFHRYDDAIQHFQQALTIAPGSAEVSFDLANAYFRKGLYSKALEAAMNVPEEGRKDDAYLTLLGDIYEHLGDNSRAEDIFTSAIVRNPDSDGGYLSLALLQLRENKLADAKLTLLKAKEHTPGSGKILWGLGLASALEGNTSEASNQLEHAVELLPEWPGSYSTLGVFYFETGQIEKAREVLNRFKNSNTGGGLDINRIEQVLAQAPGTAQSPSDPLNPDERARLLQLALFLADKTL